MTDKGRIVKFPDVAAIEAEAAAWVARFDGGDVSAEEHLKFQEWLNRSALHREAIEDYGSLWSEFDQLGQLTGPIEVAREQSKQGRRLNASWISRNWLSSAATGVAVAAGVAAVFVTGVLQPNFESQLPARPPLKIAIVSQVPVRLSYETALGARKKIKLPDGSAVDLNTGSRIDVEISGGRRDVRLVRGEAYFDVVHDQTRPFTVFAGRGVVRDIGTAFAVRLLKAAVNVSVAKGSVEVSTAASRNGSSKVVERLAIVGAGQNVMFDQKIERSELISDADMNRKLAWRQGGLVYAGEPLKAVLKDISRYSDIEIELADPALGDRPVAGSFRINQIDAVFDALDSNFGIRADWLDAKHVRLSSDRSKASPHN